MRLVAEVRFASKIPVRSFKLFSPAIGLSNNRKWSDACYIAFRLHDPHQLSFVQGTGKASDNVDHQVSILANIFLIECHIADFQGMFWEL